jgi:peptidoglycan/xylan/chitin deacetylase (PgdA/CDA1 family)
MKMVKIFIFMFIILISCSIYHAQTVAQPYEVGIWLGFRSAAVSHTFDDNDLNQLAVAVPMFNEFNFKLTLFTLTGTGTGMKNPNWSGLQVAASQGHEVASHTVTHAQLDGLSLEQQKAELEDSYNAITTNIPDQVGLTFAYPYCVRGNDSLTSHYYIGARGCQGAIERSTPYDLMNISSIVCGSLGSVKTAENFNSRANAAVNTNGLCVFLIHGIDEDGGWSPTQSSELRSHLEYLKVNDNKFWVSTFGNIVRYIKERNAVSITETDIQEDRITLQVTDTLDNAIFNFPISVRRPLPEGWPSAIVTQDGQATNVLFLDLNLITYCIFDVIPEGGEIILTKSNVSHVQNNENVIQPLYIISQNYPNPFNPETRISFQLPLASPVTIKIMNMLGQEIVMLTQKQYNAGHHIVYWDGKDHTGKQVSSGTYFYQIIAGEFIHIKKMILLR